ncbi:MAG: acetate--CoA ligase family protein [Pseudomonadota bacterium]
MPHPLEPLFRPRSVAFVGGTNMAATLRYHRDLGFAGATWIVNPKHAEIEGYACHASIEALPEAPDLAYVVIRREAAIEAVAALSAKGCKAVVCHAAGFAETGPEGAELQARLIEAAGDMALIGPNSAGLVNYVQPMAAMMDHFGVRAPEPGVAIVSQGGGFLCDAVFSDRGLAITHMVGVGNQAVTGLEACLDYLLEDERVRAVGLSFEGIRDPAALRRAAEKAQRLQKPIVAIKFGRTEAGALVAASHTASMTGAGASWDALFDRLGIVSTRSESEFFETLKLFASGQVPKGRRVLACAVSGVMGVMLADHLSAAGFELPQPSAERAALLRALLPGIATPCNPQDVTMAAWNDRARQQAIYEELLGEGYDVAIMVQNYPRAGMWDVAEYAAQLEALAGACAGRDVAAMQLAPMVDCYPAEARDETQALGLAAMQGLEECISAMGHAVAWGERAAALAGANLSAGPAEAVGPIERPVERPDEAAAKALLADAGVPVPPAMVVRAEEAGDAAGTVGFPVAIKALDARLLHKTEVGAVRLGLCDAAAVTAAVAAMKAEMAEKAPHVPLDRVLVEAMAMDVVAEVMVSVSLDPAVGPVMMIAGGGVEAELWGDSTLLAAPFTRPEIERAFDRLKVARIVAGWRGRPAGDRGALLDAIEALGRFALTSGAAEVEVNPLMVCRQGVLAVDAVMSLPAHRPAYQPADTLTDPSVSAQGEPVPQPATG